MFTQASNYTCNFVFSKYPGTQEIHTSWLRVSSDNSQYKRCCNDSRGRASRSLSSSDSSGERNPEQAKGTCREAETSMGEAARCCLRRMGALPVHPHLAQNHARPPVGAQWVFVNSLGKHPGLEEAFSKVSPTIGVCQVSLMNHSTWCANR